MNNYSEKFIGIWGFGVVGQSALAYFDQYSCKQIEILDTKPIDKPTTNNKVITTLQLADTIIPFLARNDYILVSPGITLHGYELYAHKFISELDIYQAHATWKTIAITGSVGKTTITHLLTNILQKLHYPSIAAGNIGYPMLNLITKKEANTKVILELSSFQLQQSKMFAPDLAIITNLYPNHLDHHTHVQEYYAAKANIFKRLHRNQPVIMSVKTLQLYKQYNIYLPPSEHIYLLSSDKTTAALTACNHHGKIYYLDQRIIYKMDFNQTKKLFDCNMIPFITFDENWLMIIAALDQQDVDLTNLYQVVSNLQIPDHRLQKIKNWNGSDFYNDSKSTVWQATLQAVQAIEQQTIKPIKLFLGGLDKGIDRSPLLAELKNKNIEIFAFGQQSKQIMIMCQQLQLPCTQSTTLEASFQECIASIKYPSTILFSPAGTSFDLFSNYKERGLKFIDLVNQLS